MVKFTLSINKELNDWLKEQARLNGRSKNAHIEWLLNLERVRKQVPKSPLQEERWGNIQR